MDSINNGRDCQHGRQVGKCETCDLIEAEQEISKLEAKISELQNGVLAQSIADLTRKNLGLQVRVDVLSGQVERLRGIKPELPPYPGDSFDGELPRYGIKWSGPTQPLAVPMDDGYWTPYHLAVTNQAEVKAQAGRDGFVECYFSLRKVQCGDVFDLVKAADEYANQLRQQDNPPDKINKARDEASSALQNWINEAGD